MVRKGYTPEQIIGKLREAEVLLSQGAAVAEARCRFKSIYCFLSKCQWVPPE